MILHIHCLICGSIDQQLLTPYKENHLVRCKSCSLVFSKKIPIDTELANYYNSYPVGYNTDSTTTRKRINEFLDDVEKYRKTNKMIDVGCGSGLFLLEAKKRNWEVYATEFSDKQIAYLETKGITALIGKLNDTMFEDGQFDVLISSEVIEHINNPVEEIQQFHRLLHKGGLLYITTPNFNALERHVLKNSWRIIEYPEHLTYYTPKTIDFLLRKSGFQKRKITTTGFSIADVKNGWRKKHNDIENESPLTDEALRESLEKGYKKRIKKCLNFFLNIFGIGNSLKVWYEKV